MKVLGIETSCDDTAISIIEKDGARVRVLANITHSQIEAHRPYGGVFPTLAKREHAKNLVPALDEALLRAEMNVSGTTEVPEELKTILAREPELLTALSAWLASHQKPEIDQIAVTKGPGLEPALWVGINCARALSRVWGIPVVPVNHMEGHVLISLLSPCGDDVYKLDEPRYPALSLLVSGGHTEILLSEKKGFYSRVGKTRDDAVGECFDKTARLMGLPYPGGPEISRLAHEARVQNLTSPIHLPRPMMMSGDLDMSFSGLKTAVRYGIESHGTLSDDARKGLAREIEDAITDVLIAKLSMAHERYAYDSLVVGGGVTANAFLRSALKTFAEERGISLYVPRIDHSTDNALMIAIAGSLHTGTTSDLVADGTLSIA